MHAMLFIASMKDKTARIKFNNNKQNKNNQLKKKENKTKIESTTTTQPLQRCCVVFDVNNFYE